MKPKDIKFPCLLVCRGDGYTARLSDASFFQRTSYKAFRSRYWEKCVLYNSDLEMHSIQCTSDEKWLAIYFKSLTFRTTLFNFEFNCLGSISLEDLKSILAECINKCDDLYQDSDRAKLMLGKSKNFNDLLKLALAKK